ncbi:DUF5799 family protein [Salinirussus salinus]|jgi:hypothetical protein|uniref:DUF5799 family protein n=1 Tax=Salinirussus salinus TaxID=1198300 RepID=UPI0013569AF9|nr:DUF5799 family protein [Salinirussus salinus]
MTSDWQDHLAGARMRVDQQFEQRVRDSRFSSQEWGLIMTAVEFEVRSADDPDSARLVADTDKLGAVVPELGKIQEEMGGAARPPSGSSGGGLFGRLRQYLGGLTSDSGPEGSSDEQLEAARTLADDYAVELQAYLEEQGRWADVCALAADAES